MEQETQEHGVPQIGMGEAANGAQNVFDFVCVLVIVTIVIGVGIYIYRKRN